MPAIWAALAGTGLEFAGGLMDQARGVSRRTVRRRGRFALDQAKSQEELFAGLEEAALKAGHAKETAGFRGAKRAVELGGTAARQTVQDRARAGQAALEQSIVSRGLIGTTSGAGMFAGLQDQTTRQLADIDLQLAEALSQLGLEESDVFGRQGRELAGLAAKRRARAREFQEASFGLLTQG